jgi:hypothetical protein
MTPEQWVQGVGVGFAIVVAMSAAFWWGFEVRERLARKLEYFKVSNISWHAYDEHYRKEKKAPTRAELHEIGERQSQR